jgi:hypothetical protein
MNLELRKNPAVLAATLTLLWTGSGLAAPGGGNGGGGGGGGDPEICDDGLDNDGDGKTDCQDRDCRNDAACSDDGGGGEGDVRYDYEVLPEPANSTRRLTRDMSDNRNWVSGATGRAHPCVSGTHGPTLWERDASVGWLVHELPGISGVGKGYAEAVLDDGSAVGWDDTPMPDCASRLMQPVLWEPVSSGVWSVTTLPTPPGPGAAQDVAIVAGAGTVIVGVADGQAHLWRRISGVWTVESLGSFGGSSAAYGVSSSGVVVGSAHDSAGATEHAFILVPEDSDQDGVPDTWRRDDDGDGMNDLLQSMGAGGPAMDVNEASASCGHSPLATHWESNGAGGWSEDTLPSEDFSEGTEAWALNEADQVVGTGGRPARRSTESRALLWERDGSGAWVLNDLNALTELPSKTTLSVARATNDCGDITGHATTRDGTVAFLLTPRSSSCD